MKRLSLIALVAFACLAGPALAEEGDGAKKKRPPRKRPDGIMGKITAVEGTNLIIDKRNRETRETTSVTVATDDSTKFRLDRKEAALADMKPGMFVFVTPSTGTAERVYARTQRGRDGKGKQRDKDRDKDRKKRRDREEGEE